ncbi:unnamed protein product [Didymodactylos carnosus]|uniref:SMP-30/Gluconolactonase/LRE-like region domain-containing protein n=1 Tax=Didymodactylos carnosus TaxID=1234261 RepID=A0A815V153_9BILA|nr:unnamed protein product [Didymodactylos carnosus]CAF1523787.1 unnamed protein product [Didymodactylos carnosus]CAF4246164.1 unnamed protein product [Didymodactylos carnosus]CAF4382915.1 unnamed protein product [Didymodactylos carnosus]
MQVSLFSLILFVSVHQYALPSQITCNSVGFNKSSSSCFQIYDKKFQSILGAKPVLKLLAKRNYAFAHEGPVWLPQTNSVLFVSNRQGNLATSDQWIDIYTINLESGFVKNITEKISRLTGHNHFMANGGTGNYQKKSIILCSQGYRLHGGSIFEITNKFDRVLLTVKQYNNLTFNSPNDVVISHKDKSVWFTDPEYGFFQNFRYGKPQLGNNVYRVDIDGNIQILIDNLSRPNGIAFNPDETIVYVTDTGYAVGNGSLDSNVKRAIYSYEIYRHEYKPIHLYNKRLFAIVDAGIPDGIKIDQNGHVYVGCGDGVEVFGANGKLLGKIIPPNSTSGVSNLVLANKKLVLLAETEIWTVDLQCQKCGTTLTQY